MHPALPRSVLYLFGVDSACLMEVRSQPSTRRYRARFCICLALMPDASGEVRSQPATRSLTTRGFSQAPLCVLLKSCLNHAATVSAVF